MMKKNFCLIIQDGKKSKQIFADSYDDLIKKVPAEDKKTVKPKTTKKDGE